MLPSKGKRKTWSEIQTVSGLTYSEDMVWAWLLETRDYYHSNIIKPW
jgi:hypothetical protein